MLRRILSAFGKRFPPNDATGERHPPSAEPISETRRGFFTKAAIGAVAISGTAGLAKVVGDTVAEPDLRARYRKDSLAGESELRERKYVLMSDEEKEDMVQHLVDNYEKG
jgi:hypothetical protein